MGYNQDYYQKNKEELKQKRRERYYKTSEKLKYKKTRTKIVLNYKIDLEGQHKII